MWDFIRNLIGAPAAKPAPARKLNEYEIRYNAKKAKTALELDDIDQSWNDCRDFTKLEALPSGIRTEHLDVSGLTLLTQLPADLQCGDLQARNMALRSLPEDLSVSYRLDLSGCQSLVELPDNLHMDHLIVRDCVGLTCLSENISVYVLNISGCRNIRDWPASLHIKGGRLVARGCIGLTSLPLQLKRLSQLDLAGCANIASLPEDLVVTSMLDIAGTGITELPSGCSDSDLRWRGVRIDERIAFYPETITIDEILAEENTERRRVLIERMGYEKFMDQSKAQVIDKDKDAGGERKLLKLPIQGDEDLVCVAVNCPSTGRRYILRVPPTMRTCRQAVAWIAGFDNADDYKPLAET